jgi:UDP-GlcNAc:undecaprenyl-phosphate/decaprenyl-phosphate GlcNAc-1-phosphate transferase
VTESHPSLEYVLVACVAAAVTFMLTPIARRVAIRWQALAMPRDRDVHAVATPRLGGVALFTGFALALFVAARLPSLDRSFDNGPEMPWVVLSAAIICAVGIIDDRYELDSLTKLAGQVLACGIMVTKGGVQLLLIPLGHSTVSLGRDLGIPVTILFALLIINAMNFIDGLDGLASGVTVIAASAFFVFSFHMAKDGFTDVSAAPTLLAAALAGACAGFLPHNFWPARIFMGDSGSMVVGLVLAAAATSATTSADPQAFDSALGSVAFYLPLLIPVAVLALPFIDLSLAIVRRVRKGRSPFAPDKQHLHHRLLELGHSHRRAVLLLYFWSALVAAAGVGVSFENEQWFVVASLGTLAVVGILVSVVPGVRGRTKSRPAARP